MPNSVQRTNKIREGRQVRKGEEEHTTLNMAARADLKNKGHLIQHLKEVSKLFLYLTCIQHYGSFKKIYFYYV